jgi:hypothetical protein
MMYSSTVVYRAPGCGAMGQPWTIQTGALVIQMVATAQDQIIMRRIQLGMTTTVPLRNFIMFVNCKNLLF